MASASSQKADDAPSMAPDEAAKPSTASEDVSQDSDPYSQRKDSVSQSFTSEDSQTVILNHPSAPETQPPATAAHQDTSKAKSLGVPKDASPPQEEPEPAKCWICFSDETEDGATSSEWRSPCPCALKAHESCLLDWIADLKKSKERESQVIQCPQCKGVIHLAEPRSAIARFVRALEMIGGRMTSPMVVISLGGTIIAALWFHGYATIYLVLGTKDAERFLGLDSPAGAINIEHAVLLPLIPFVLTSSRFAMFDKLLRGLGLLPSVAFAFSAMKNPAYYLRWPPPHYTTFSCIPFIYVAYKQLYEKYMQPFKIKWEAEKAGRTERGNDVAVAEDQNLGGLGMELGVQLEIEEEVLVEDAGDQPPNAQQQQAGDDNRAQNEEQAPNNNALPLPNAGAPGNPPAGNQEGRFLIDLKGLAQRVLGSLLFPVFSVSMGSAISWFLPRTWVMPPGIYDKYPRGLLQSRFGRTVIGGCLFVALKDTLQLYAAYHSALAYRQRRILDYKPNPNKSKYS